MYSCSLKRISPSGKCAQRGKTTMHGAAVFTSTDCDCARHVVPCVVSTSTACRKLTFYWSCKYNSCASLLNQALRKAMLHPLKCALLFLCVNTKNWYRYHNVCFKSCFLQPPPHIHWLHRHAREQVCHSNPRSLALFFFPYSHAFWRRAAQSALHLGTVKTVHLAHILILHLNEALHVVRRLVTHNLARLWGWHWKRTCSNVLLRADCRSKKREVLTCWLFNRRTRGYPSYCDKIVKS